MKRTLAFLLTVCMVFTLFACGSNSMVTMTQTQTQTRTQTQGQTAISGGQAPVKTKEIDYPQVKNPLTWDQINAIPLATAEMSSDELRKICVDFQRLQLSFQWTPDADLKYMLESRRKDMDFPKGKVYAGIPYYTSSPGNETLYTFMEYYDSETGILRVSELGSKRLISIIGSDCASSIFWAWSRVINSTTAYTDFNLRRGITNDGKVPKNGFLSVGDFICPVEESWYEKDGTKTACEVNGEQGMYRVYAALLPADGLIEFYPKNEQRDYANHVMMNSALPHVEYNPDGTIDGEKSYLTIMDQRSTVTETVTESGETIYVEGGIDAVFTFKEMFDSCYVPYTFKEFHGLDPVERAVAESGMKANSFTFDELFQTKITANYPICSYRIFISDGEGNEVYSTIAHAPRDNTMSASVSEFFYPTYSRYANGANRLSIRVRVSTGEEFTVLEGVLKP